MISSGTPPPTKALKYDLDGCGEAQDDEGEQ